MENNRNFFITIALSVVILTLWQVFYMNPRIEAQREAAEIQAQQQQATTPQGQAAGGAAGDGDVPTAPGTAAEVPGSGAAGAAPQTREAAIAGTNRIAIDTPRLSGSINLTGARIDDLLLKDYRVTVEPNSPNISLLNPSALADGYYAETGYVAGGNAGTVPALPPAT